MNAHTSNKDLIVAKWEQLFADGEDRSAEDICEMIRITQPLEDGELAEAKEDIDAIRRFGLFQVSSSTEFDSKDMDCLTTGQIVSTHSKLTIESECNGGGFGIIHIAKDKSLHRKIAIKESLSNNRQSRKQFRNEAAVMAQLNHPGVPAVFSLGQTGDADDDKLFYSCLLYTSPSPRD